MLLKINHPTPYIYLKGIKRDVIEPILDFLYNGETKVAQEELNTFLETAQEIQVRGLQNHRQKDNNQQIYSTHEGKIPLCKSLSRL